MLFSILFVLAFLAQTTLVGACNPCKEDGFVMTQNAKISVGKEFWWCNEFEERKNEFSGNSCALMQSYAIKHCGCRNPNRSPPPRPPYKMKKGCNICGGPNGSNLWTPAASQWNANVGAGSLGVTATCGFFFQTALQGAFGGPQNPNCYTLRESTRAMCWCGGPGWD